MNFKSFVQLTRFEHSLMLVLAVLIGQALALGRLPDAQIALLASIPPFFIGLASFAINDYFDVETDKRNKRTDRPLVNRSATRSEAYYLSLALFLAGVAISFALPQDCYVIASSFAMAAFLYSLKLKDLPLAGNAYIALTMAVPFVYGSYSVQVPPETKPAVLVLASIAFVTGLAREIAGDARDAKGDKARGSRTLPMVIGRRNSLVLHSVLYLAAILLSFYPYLYVEGFKGNLGYLAFIALTDLLVLYSALAPLLDPSVKTLKRARNTSLAALGTGLVGFLLGALK